MKYCRNGFFSSAQQMKRRTREYVPIPPFMNPSSKNTSILNQVLLEFRAPIRFAFAYGSGVFQQEGYSNQNRPMIDFVFGVTHPQHWHSINLQENFHHYSNLKYLGSSALEYIQNNFGAGIYYNPFVNINGISIKYGIISIDHICDDLSNWKNFYLAGRMHKPIQILRHDSRISMNQWTNLSNALTLALLLSPEKIDMIDLFSIIANLSYSGDFRTRYKLENPNKIHNLVHAQVDHFEYIYRTIFKQVPYFNNLATWDEKYIHIDKSVASIVSMLKTLPIGFLEKLKLYHSRHITNQQHWKRPNDEHEMLVGIAQSPQLPEYIEKSLYDTIYGPAMYQSIKGIFTAGISKSIRYSLAKLEKAKTK